VLSTLYRWLIYCRQVQKCITFKTNKTIAKMHIRVQLCHVAVPQYYIMLTVASSADFSTTPHSHL